MNRFPLPLDIRHPLDANGGELLAPFQYHDPEHGLITVPAGFETDFASVRPVRNIAVGLLLAGVLVGLLLPWLGLLLIVAGIVALALYAAVVGYGDAAATVHDWLYASAMLPRAQADSIYYNAERSSGRARWRAWVVWAGVRIGGHWRYQRGRLL